MAVSTKLMTADELLMLPENGKRYELTEVATDRLPPGDLPNGYLRLAPDLVVEVASPSDTASELQSKVCTWLDAGCRLVWVVYPATRSVTVYRSRADVRVLGADDVLDGGPVLDGLSAEVRELFR